MARKGVRVDVDGRNKTKKAFDGAERGLDRLAKKAAVVTGAVTGIAAGVAAVRGVTRAVEEAIKAVDDLGIAARRANVPVETFSAWQAFFEQMGVETDRFDEGLKTLNERIGEAFAEPDAAIAESFRSMGIEVRGLDGAVRSVTDILPEMLEYFRTSSSQLALFRALEIGGDDFRDFVRVAKDSTIAFDDVEEAMKKLGVTWDEAAVQTAREASYEMVKFRQVMSTLGTEVALGVLPHFTALAARVTEMLTAMREGDKDLRDFANAAADEFSLAELNKFLGAAQAAREEYSPDNILDWVVGGFEYSPARAEELKREEEKWIAAIEEWHRRVSGAAAAPAEDTGKARDVEDEALTALRTAVEKQLAIVAMQGQEVEYYRQILEGTVAVQDKYFDDLTERQQQFIRDLVESADKAKQEVDRITTVTAEDRILGELRSRDKEAGDLLGLAQRPSVFPGSQEAVDQNRVSNEARRRLAESIKAGEGDLGSMFTEGLREKTDNTVASFAEGLVDSIGSNLEQALISGNFDNFADAVLASITSALISEAIDGEAIVGFLGSLFGGPKQFGGLVSSGRAYLVGEKGPELLVPTFDGTVIPNNRMGGMMGGGGSVVINMSNNYTGLSYEEAAALSEQQAQAIEARMVTLMQQGRVDIRG